MINYQLGFVLSLLGHVLILLVITLDFSIFLPKEKIFEVIPIGFVQEKREENKIKGSSEIFSLLDLEKKEINAPFKKNLESQPNNSNLSISAKETLEKLELNKNLKTINLIQEKFINLWNKPFVLNENIQASIKLTLSPSGEILSSSLISSSGNKKFDESALKAVSKVNFLTELSKIKRTDFEKYFREITLVFKS
jgi:TonB family protein|tara:strand:- start:3814 stop:4398 length:585 start_codon:yes stop_codon:yes gene_type:complete